jgi:hypothetical protein
MKVKMLIVVFLLNTALAFAQEKPRFSSLNYVGILEGETGTALQLQSVNGIKYKTWFTGIGAGIDYYYQRSVPLFISLAKFLPSGKRPFYFYADAGINFPWTKNGIYYFQYRGEMSSSFYWAGGLGYQFKFKKINEGLLVNIGYSYKHLMQEYEYSGACFNPPCPVYKERYDYRLKRLSFKAGWIF